MMAGLMPAPGLLDVSVRNCRCFTRADVLVSQYVGTFLYVQITIIPILRWSFVNYYSQNDKYTLVSRYPFS